MSESSKLKQLEQRLASLEARISSSNSSETSHTFPQGKPEVQIYVHFGRVAVERKPFVVTFEAAQRITKNLSTIRAAIVMILFVDLHERSQGAESSEAMFDRVKEVYNKLSVDCEETLTRDSVRMAFYRATQFIEEDFSGLLSEDYQLKIEKNQLALYRKGQIVPAPVIDIDITTSDSDISALLDRSLATSPFARLRKSKSLYVPPGEDGQDRILLELLDHPYPVKQTSIFYRPTVQGLPLELANKMRFNSNRLKRIPVSQQGYQDGRIQYTEILSRKKLWNLTNRTPGQGFEMYPRDVNQVDVVRHVEHIMFLLQSTESYRLVITDAFVPFYITTFEVMTPNEIERYTLFFQTSDEEDIKRVSTFALKDDSVYFSTHDKIVNWILGHPTTISSREHTLAELAAIKEVLLEDSDNPRIGFPSATDSNRSASANQSHFEHGVAADLQLEVEVSNAEKEDSIGIDILGSSEDKNPTNRK